MWSRPKKDEESAFVFGRHMTITMSLGLFTSCLWLVLVVSSLASPLEVVLGLVAPLYGEFGRFPCQRVSVDALVSKLAQQSPNDALKEIDSLLNVGVLFPLT